MIRNPDGVITPRCTATVDLLSKYFRPFNFLVTVRGEPPHAHVRRYKIAAPSEDDAAGCGMQLFMNEFTPKILREGQQLLAPTSKRFE